MGPMNTAKSLLVTAFTALATLAGWAGATSLARAADYEQRLCGIHRAHE